MHHLETRHLLQYDKRRLVTFALPEAITPGRNIDTMKRGEGLPRKEFLRKNSVETLATQAIQEIFSESFLRCKGVFGNKVMLASNSEKSSDFEERP